jgi:hypothetical protein
MKGGARRRRRIQKIDIPGSTCGGDLQENERILIELISMIRDPS